MSTPQSQTPTSQRSACQNDASWSGFAPGKLILSGEHSVVYGHQAIAMAVHRGLSITLKSIDAPSRFHLDNPLLWNIFQHFIPAHGLEIHVESSLPMGRGMGSSAALSIAFLRALANHNHEIPTFEDLYQKGMEIEGYFHGNPSGVDHTVSALGKTILYQKGTPPKIQPLQIQPISLLILDSGSAGNTGEQVQKVAEHFHLSKIQNALQRMGQCTKDILSSLCGEEQNLEDLGRLFTENHQLLKQIGVSTPKLDHMVNEALDFGALGAKLSGAGGGGIIMALFPKEHSEQALISHFTQLGYHPFMVQPYRDSL